MYYHTKIFWFISVSLLQLVYYDFTIMSRGLYSYKYNSKLGKVDYFLTGSFEGRWRELPGLLEDRAWAK